MQPYRLAPYHLSCMDIAVDGTVRGVFLGGAWSGFSAIHALKYDPYSVTMRGFLSETGGNMFRLAFVGVFAGLQCKFERVREVKHWTNWALAGLFTGGTLGFIETRSSRQAVACGVVGAGVGALVSTVRPRLGMQDVS